MVSPVARRYTVAQYAEAVPVCLHGALGSMSLEPGNGVSYFTVQTVAYLAPEMTDEHFKRRFFF